MCTYHTRYSRYPWLCWMTHHLISLASAGTDVILPFDHQKMWLFKLISCRLATARQYAASELHLDLQKMWLFKLNSCRLATARQRTRCTGRPRGSARGCWSWIGCWERVRQTTAGSRSICRGSPGRLPGQGHLRVVRCSVWFMELVFSRTCSTIDTKHRV